MKMQLIFAGLATVLLGAFASASHAQQSVSLMSILIEWRYPDSTFNGATMADGGNPEFQSIKCKAVLTTADPLTKVIEYYAKKLDITPKPRNSAAEGDAKPVQASSITVQDDSDGRPVAIHVIVVNEKKSSTTLVISRAESESETHIAWSHYRRL